MRIIQFLGQLDTGGAESLVRDYAIELTKRGHEVLVPVYYTNPDFPNQIALEENGVKIKVLRGKYSKNILKRGYNKLLTYSDFNGRYLKKLIKEFKPDVLHIHGYVFSDFRNILKELNGIRLYYTCHMPAKYFFSDNWKKQFYIAKKMIDSYNLQMIALHSEMAKELNTLFKINNTVVLNNPININKISKQKNSREKVRHKLKISEDALVIGHVGRFEKEKNHVLILNVFKEVIKVESKAHLLLIGGSGGSQFGKIDDLISQYKLEKNVTILFDRADIEELYSVMNVFLFPSLYEGLGIALLEAQVAGIKCVISDTIPERAIVSSDVFVNSLNAPIESWVDLILKNEKGNYQSKYNEEDYDITTVVDDLLSIYQK